MPQVVYTTWDGKEFDNKGKANKHESELNDGLVIFYASHYAFSMNDYEYLVTDDLGYILVSGSGDESGLFAERFCIEHWGDRVSFEKVMGKEILIERWRVHKTNRNLTSLPNDATILAKIGKAFGDGQYYFSGS